MHFPSSRTTCTLLLLLNPALLAGVAGCGYSHGGLYPQGVRTIAVPIFENRTAYRDVEFDLTEALIKEIELRTPYKVVRGENADTVLEGVITGVEQRTVSRNDVGGLPQQMEVVMVLTFEWRDQRSGEVIKDRHGFATVAQYVPGRPAGEPFRVGQQGVAERAARDIVATLRTDW